MNNAHVTTALQHIDAVIAARGHLAELHEAQARLTPSDHARREGYGRKIAEQYDAIRVGTKLAETHAQIAQAVALERIANALDRLAPVRVAKGQAVTL